MGDVPQGIALALTANLVTAVALVIQKVLASEEAIVTECPSGQDPFAAPCDGSILGGSRSPRVAGWGMCLLAYLMLSLGYFLDMLCLAHLSLSSVGALSASQLVFSTLIGCLFLGEAVSTTGAAGVLCIVGGCVAMIMASPDARGAKDEDILVLWLSLTGATTAAMTVAASLRERMWPSEVALSEMVRWGLSLVPWLFVAAAGLSASDTLLLSKMLIEADLFERRLLLVAAIVVEIVIQLYLVKAAFAAAAAPGVVIPDPCVVVASTFAVTTILIATMCAGVVYGEFSDYSPLQWGASSGGLAATATGLFLLGGGRERRR